MYRGCGLTPHNDLASANLAVKLEKSEVDTASELAPALIRPSPPQIMMSRGLDAGYGSQTGRQSLYEGFNRNKRSLTLNTGKPRALEIAYKLVEPADVFVTRVGTRTESQFAR